MAKQSIKGFVELAAGLGEMTTSRAMEAAGEIAALAGLDTSRKKVAKQAKRLADDLLEAAASNQQALVHLIGREVETQLARLDVGKLLADVQAVSAQVDELAELVAMRARDMGVPAQLVPARRGRATPTSTSEPVAAAAAEPATTEAAPARRRPSRAAATGRAGAKRTSRSTTTRSPATTKSVSTKAAATKAAATKATAKKAPATKAATKAAATKAAATKAMAKKAPATKAATKATATKATAKKAPAKKAPAKRATATPTAKKATGGA